jgi:hypothetical protein
MHTNGQSEDLASARRASPRASQGKLAEAFAIPNSFTYARGLAALSPHPRARLPQSSNPARVK